MLDPEKIEEFNRRLSEMLAASPAKDLEKNLRAFAAAWLARLNVATREELDAQQRLLDAAVARLAELEQKIAALEKSAKKTPRKRAQKTAAKKPAA